MDYIITIPLLSTIMFCLVKFLERRYLSDETQRNSLKFIFRDAIVVFIVTLVANYMYCNIHTHIDNLVNVITETKSLASGNAEIFTDLPNF